MKRWQSRQIHDLCAVGGRPLASLTTSGRRPRPGGHGRRPRPAAKAGGRGWAAETGGPCSAVTQGRRRRPRLAGPGLWPEATGHSLWPVAIGPWLTAYGRRHTAARHRRPANSRRPAIPLHPPAGGRGQRPAADCWRLATTDRQPAAAGTSRPSSTKRAEKRIERTLQVRIQTN